MVQVKCIEKLRDKNNHIIGYKLIDKNNNEVLVKAEKLKEIIRSKQLEVINLTLTSDNRLIDKKQDTSLKPMNKSKTKNINAESLLVKVKTIGYNVTTIDTVCGHKCYIASPPDNSNNLLIIPDDVKCIYDEYKWWDSEFKRIERVKGNLKVIGGKGLNSTYHMFSNCRANLIDLSSFDSSNVVNMSYMFCNCEAKSIDLRSLNASKVTDMSYMFFKCEAKSIDLTSFNTSSVTNMESMFRECWARSLDLRSFNTSNVITMKQMFDHCYYAKSIDLTSFDTSKVEDMYGMFDTCQTQSLDLSSFNTGNVTNMERMFCDCKAQSIDLSSFHTGNETNINKMFYECEAQIKVNDFRLKSQLQNDFSLETQLRKDLQEYKKLCNQV